MKPRIAIPVPHSESDYAQRALAQYEDAVRQAGGEPVPVSLNLSNQQIAQVAKGCDGILLPGSKADLDPEKYGAARDPRTTQADPARDNVDELLLQDAFNMRKPILGICYGLQALNVWRTGTLVQHIESEINHAAGRSVPRAHTVTVEHGSRLAGIVAPVKEFAAELCGDGRDEEPRKKISLSVNSSHHQAAEVVGDGLRVVARSEPDRVIEALEGTAPDHFVLAVQWHPERSVADDEPSRAIFQAFVQAALHRHEQPRTPVPDFESMPK